MQNPPLTERLMLRAYAWWLRRRRPYVLDITQAIRRVERLLVCLPPDVPETDAALAVVPRIVACLDARAITIIAREEAQAACEQLSLPVRVVTLRPEDRRWSGLPAPGLVDRVKADGVIDAAIDLTPRLNLLTAALCVQTGALMRIGVRDHRSDAFFNLQLAVPPDDPASLADRPFYPRLLRTIEGLVGKSA